MRRSAPCAALAITAYTYALVVAPWLHADHHARFGADHVHDASGTHAIAASSDLDLAHADFHTDLAALALDDAATAGTLSVDCSLSQYTLTECTPDAPHAPRFGDALVAHNRHPRPIDPLHGQGALEHLAKSMLYPQPVVLPPPSAPHVAPALLAHVAPLESLAATAPQARGPPV